MKIGYEQTDKKIEIEIYGLKFEIKNVDRIEEFNEVKDNDLDGLKEIINTLLGDKAVDKINEKRKADGYNEMDNEVAINIFLGIFKAYTESYLTDITKTFDKAEKTLDSMNRKTRRNYNRGNRRYYDRY